MNTQEIQIRAKKISELDPFENQDNNNAYLVIGYNNGSIKQNYKITLGKLISLIGNNASMDEETLLEKLNMFIDTNQIAIPTGARGPQGPQGPAGSGSDIDLSDIQHQIDDINNYLGRNITYYNISYILDHIRSNSSNPTVIAENKSITVYFSPANGYKLPNSVTVTGCQFTYNKSNNSITLSNPTSDVTINISGELANYSISYSFTNINYEITSGQKSSYQIGDVIELLLTAKTDYKLPDSISTSNCSNVYIKNNNAGTATLTLTCSGTGNMSVSGSGVSTILYYFGYLKDNDTSNISVTYDTYSNGDFKGLRSVTVLSTSKLTSSTSCPFNVNSTLTLSGIGYGATVILLVPTKYFNIQTKEFVNASNQKYGLYPKLAQVTPLSFPYYCTTTISGISYYALYLENQRDGAEYIFK